MNIKEINKKLFKRKKLTLEERYQKTNFIRTAHILSILWILLGVMQFLNPSRFMILVDIAVIIIFIQFNHRMMDRHRKYSNIVSKWIKEVDKWVGQTKPRTSAKNQKKKRNQ